MTRSGDFLSSSDQDRDADLGWRIVDALPDHISAVSLDYRYVWVNGAYEKAHGVSKDQIVGARVADMLGQEKFDNVVEPMFAECLAGGEVQFESWFEFAAIGRRYMSVTYSLLRCPDGAPDGYLVVARHMTERKLAEDALRESEERFRDFARMSADWFWETDADLRFSYFSRRSREITGFDPERYLGKTRREIAAENTDDPRWRHHFETLDRRQPFRDFEYELTGAGGKRLTVSISGRPVFDAAGNFAGYRGTGRDVTEQRRAEQVLSAALRDAEQANRAKSDLLATMSHEFRTPLNAIIGFSDVLRFQHFGQLGSAKYRDYAEDINDSGQHLLALVNDLLDVAAIEAGKRTIKKEDIQVRELLDSCVKVIEVAAREKNISVSVSVPATAATISADKRSMVQIFHNLLSNAVKFTGEGGAIEVGAEATAGTMVFRVSDNGAGISAERLPRITEPFSHSDSGAHHTHDGTGLGLSIVKGLVEAHGGHLSIESEVGVGTVVSFTLPGST